MIHFSVTTSGKACVFPFEYRGTYYNACTKYDSAEGRLWCGLQAVTCNPICYFRVDWDYCIGKGMGAIHAIVLIL